MKRVYAYVFSHVHTVLRVYLQVSESYSVRIIYEHSHNRWVSYSRAYLLFCAQYIQHLPVMKSEAGDDRTVNFQQSGTSHDADPRLDVLIQAKCS